MKKFMNENFMLYNDIAVELYHSFAKDVPIIDYHCHLSPKEIFENKRFKNITEVWLYGDHYKWRLMRTYGVDEKYITGDGSDYDKFLAWASVLPKAIGNPLYHWTHLELQRYFGIDEILNEKTAPAIWDKANELLRSEDFSARALISKSKVEILCTTDDPADSLEYHLKLKEEKDFPVKVLPAFRPDKALNVSKKEFGEYVDKLGEVCGKVIKDYEDLLNALSARASLFHSVGCRISDHALDSVPYAKTTKEAAAQIFLKAIKGETITSLQEDQYRTYTLLYLSGLYEKHGWAMQLHINAYRNNNSKMFRTLGPDTGYDSVNDNLLAYQMSNLLNSMEEAHSLPKTILYTLNPKDHYVLGTLMGCFQGDGIKGKMQLGAAWWFLDHRDGMVEQMKALANVGLLSCFVGMLTDSRSFLSYPRHEYFRRILCNLIGEWVMNGEYPYDREFLGNLVTDICYGNAKEYFNL